jgi:hypothetical protein
MHHEPPEVAWLLPELDDGLEPELKPLEPLEPVWFDVEPELELEPELEAEPELELEPELEAADDPEFADDDAPVSCVDPGRPRATAPATATPARVTAVVVERTLARPCSLAATARRMRSACALLMVPILRSGLRRSLSGSSGFAMR